MLGISQILQVCIEIHPMAQNSSTLSFFRIEVPFHLRCMCLEWNFMCKNIKALRKYSVEADSVRSFGELS